MPALDVDDLSVRYDGDEGSVHAVDGVSFTLEHGETFGLVGESGCGKTTLAKALLQLLDGGRVEGGSVWFDGTLPRWTDERGDPRPEIVADDGSPVREDGMTDLTRLDAADIRQMRWREVALVPQNAMNALNPVYRVGDQIVEAIRHHEPETSEAEADERARALLERVGVDPARADDYAHQLSGGICQRAVVAMAVACDPSVLVADEPTTALDVVVQDRVLDRLERLQAEFDLSVLFISHDVAVLAEVCDRLGVMYGGKLMEAGPVGDVLDDPANPYTLGLTNAFPTPAADRELVSIPGSATTPVDPDDGCRFLDRCPFAVPACSTEHPPSYDVEAAERGRRRVADDRRHRSACHRVTELDRLRTTATREGTWRDRS
jgi:oligopeptide/dipeptide ABC transporter ATP-binding protein